MNIKESTMIRIKKETTELLKQIGKKGQTYDEVIKELIKIYNQTKK